MLFGEYKKTFLFIGLNFLCVYGSQDSSAGSDKSFNFCSESLHAVGLQLHEQNSASHEKIETDQNKVLHAIMTELDNLHLNMDLNFVGIRRMLTQLDGKVTSLDQRFKKIENFSEKKARSVSFDETFTKKN